MVQSLHPPESVELDSPIMRDGEYHSKLIKLINDQVARRVGSLDDLLPLGT